MSLSGEIVSAKSMQALYLEERTNKLILEDSHAFAIYSFTDEGVYIEDIFVMEDFRKSGHAAKLADKIALIAKVRGVTKMIGSVCPSAKGSTASLKVLLAYGMKLVSASNNMIWFVKEL